MPAKITMGIMPNTIVPLSDKEAEGVTRAEFAFIQELQKGVDQLSASQTFSGNVEKGKVTATQILETQKQARVILSLIVFSATMMEKKVGNIKLMLLIRNWFDPIDDVFDETRNIIRNKYRKISVERSIEGEGIGRRVVTVTDEIPPSQEIHDREEAIKRSTGKPTRLIFLNPLEMVSTKRTWVVNVVPKERNKTEAAKINFGIMFQQLMSFFGPDVNIPYFEEKFAEAWGLDMDKAFARGTGFQQEALALTQQEGGEKVGRRVTRVPESLEV